ncbi:hypothetical protein BSGG_4438 [Bacteroides sp. D2]|nr:hypothetical protein BSGG_4438 [Bacteroides sp. D2]
MIIVFFTMASNISAIRKSIILKDKDFQAKFYALILSGEKDKAKLLLFEQISKEESFIYAILYQNDKKIDTMQEKFSKEYDSELQLLGIEKLDMSMLKISKE